MKGDVHDSVSQRSIDLSFGAASKQIMQNQLWEMLLMGYGTPNIEWGLPTRYADHLRLSFQI